MQNLLTIEQNFLNLPLVKIGFNLTEVNKVKRQIANAQKSKFDHTMHLAGCIKTAVEYFDSEQGKTLMQYEGIAWSKEEFGQKVFGFQKSYFYKLIKASNLAPQIVDGYKAKCDELGVDSDRSLAGLLEFSRNVNIEVSEGATAEEVEQATAEAIAETSIERTNTIFTLSFKNPNGGNVSVRIDENGKMKTTNSADDILNAIAFLQAQLLA